MENWQIGSGDPFCKAKTNLGQSAELQKQIVSLRESRALLDQKQRMREERVTRISFQFKTILSQMKQAQEDAFVAQERNMKLLCLFPQISRSQSEEQSEGPNFQHEKHQLSVIQEEARESDQNPSTSESNYAGSSLKISSIIGRTKSLNTNSRARANSSHSPLGSLLLPSHSDAQEKMEQAQTPQSFSKVILCDDSKDLIAGQQRHTERLPSSDARAKTNYHTMEESETCIGVESPKQDSTLSDIVTRELQTSDLNHHKIELENDRGLRALCISDFNIDHHDGGMKSSPLLLDGSSFVIMSNEETSDRKEFEKQNIFEQKNALVKIEKNDFFPDIIEHDVYGRGEEAAKTSNSVVLSSKQVAEANPNDSDETSSVTSDSVEQGGDIRKTENLRNLITTWSSDEKLSVLTTLKNTMFLWENHFSQFGCWPEAEILLSSLNFAKDSQLKLFEYLDAQEDISRPLTCCGAVYELVKAYPPEKLLPFKFMTELFASDDWNHRSHDVLTLGHLEVFQHEHSQFWQMLVHHSICVKDLGLGTLNEVASTLREIFCPREFLVDLPPEVGLKVHENVLEFLNGVFKGHKSPTQSILGETESNSEPLDYNIVIPVQKGLPYDLKRLRVYKVEAAQTSVRDVLVSDGLDLSLLRYDFLEIGKGYKSEGSTRSKGSKKGLFSSLGSLVRTPFKLWRSRGMSKGTPSIDEGFVRLLSPKRTILRAR